VGGAIALHEGRQDVNFSYLLGVSANDVV